MRFCRLQALVFAFLLLSGAGQARATPPSGDDLQQYIGSASPEMEKLDLPEGELASLYVLHDNKLFWNFTESNSASTTAAFLKSLEQVVLYHGLRIEDYPIEAIKALDAAKDDKGGPGLDILTTASLLRLAHDLHGDTAELDKEYTGWVFQRASLDIAARLSEALANGSANNFIGGLAPKSPAYAKLATALQTYRDMAAKGGWAPIDAGAPLRPDDRGPRVLQLRARLAAEDYIPSPPAPSDMFDGDLEKAVIQYQIRNGLQPDGHVGGKTLDAMNLPIASRIEQIRANMERWRHMPEDFPPDRYALVNMADATLQIVEEGKEIYRGLVVVGKIDRKTPFIQSRIRSMIVNPSWHVPVKIAQKDILPKLRKDPHYLEKLGFVIKGNEADPYGEKIDWKKVPEHAFNFSLRQSPGDQNSLGHLKFDFDNDFAVYMHGTPHQDLFDKAQRNFSSGCIRLQEPDDVGEILLRDTPGHWDAEKIEKEIDDGKTRWVTIKNPMPLYVLYWSVFFDPESGAINFRKDVYDYDQILVTAPSSADSVKPEAAP